MRKLIYISNAFVTITHILLKSNYKTYPTLPLRPKLGMFVIK